MSFGNSVFKTADEWTRVSNICRQMLETSNFNAMLTKALAPPNASISAEHIDKTVEQMRIREYAGLSEFIATVRKLL